MRNRKIILLVSIIAIIVVTGGCATKGNVKQDPPADSKVITDIIIADNALEIKANAPFSYTIYKPSDPYQVILDIPEVGPGRFREKIISSSAGITEVIPSQPESSKTASRLDILLQSPSEIEPLYHDKVLVLKVKEFAVPKTDAPQADALPAEIRMAKPVSEERVEVKEKEKEKKESSPSSSAPSAASENSTIMEIGKEDEKALLSKATEIRDLRLESADGVVRLLIKGDGSMNPTVFALENGIVIDIPEVTLKAKAPSTVFAPIKGVRAGKYKEKTRLVIDLREMKAFDVSSEIDGIVVSIQGGEPGMIAAASRQESAHEPPKAVVAEQKETSSPKPRKTEPAEKKEVPAQKAAASANGGEAMEAKEPETITEGKHTGKKISLDFQDADIVPMFRLFSDISGYNMVVNPEVKGKITMKLINVPWDQALDLILKMFSLGKIVEGNIIRIAPLSVFAKESEERSKAKEAEVKAEALETKIFPVSYADVSVVEKAIKESKMLSSRGSVSVDKRTSALVIKDVPSVLPQVENLLQTLDKPIPQVMIEARIVEVSTTSASDLGIQWGVQISATNTLSSFGGFPTLGTGAFAGNSFMVDFPSGSAGKGSGSGFNFGIINPAKTLGLDLQLAALEKVGNTKIISNPRLVTTDNEKATIMQGTSEPYPQLTPEGTISTSYKDIVLLAEVTPHITPLGSVSMSVLVRKEDVIGTVNIGGSAVPRTSKIESNTKVLVQNGETLVIGGVYKKIERSSSSGLPGLMDIPILGWLFRNKLNTEEVSELMMFITPRIIEKR